MYKYIYFVLILLTLSACGGGSNDGAETSNNSTNQQTNTGSVDARIYPYHDTILLFSSRKVKTFAF